MNHIINNRTCIHESQVEGVSETQLYWLDSGKFGTPLVISSLNGPADMWGLESWQTDKLIESDIMLDLNLLDSTFFAS